MATPAPSDDTIQLDLGSLPSDPTFPAWLATLITAIGAIVPIPPEAALAALQALCRPYAKGGTQRPLVDGLKATHRAVFTSAYHTKWHEIDAARKDTARAADAAAWREALPASERQAIPVVREEAAPVEAAPVLVSVPVVRPGKWAPLMTDTRHPSGYRCATGTERHRRVDPAAWGARIEGATVAPGDIVRLTNNAGTRSTLQRVTAIVAVNTATAETFATVEAAPDDALTPRLVAQGSAPVLTPATSQVVYPSMPEGAIPLSSLLPADLRESGDAAIAGLASEIATVEAQLASIAAEGATIATAPSASASERIEPTTRGNGASTDSGASIGIFARPASERAFRIGDGTVRPREGARATVEERTRLLNERELIAGSIAADGWLQVSWTGEGQTQHGQILDALMRIERETDAPGVPSGVHYAGDAVDTLKGRDYDTKRLPQSAVPHGGKARWIVGRALQGAGAITAGDAYGTVLLTVDLREDETLAFEGDITLANLIRTRYTTAVAKVVLKSDTLTPWLGRTLRTRHGAVKRGHCWYVPPGHAMAVRALIGGAQYAEAVRVWAENGGNGPLPKFDDGSIGALWGDHELMSVNTGGDLLSSLTRGLANDVARVECAFADATALAKDAAMRQAMKKAAKVHRATEAFIEAEGKKAHERGVISDVVAARLLKDLGTCAARVSGYATVLGEASTNGIEARIATLRATLEALTDDTSVRGAMLELDNPSGLSSEG